MDDSKVGAHGAINPTPKKTYSQQDWQDPQNIRAAGYRGKPKLCHQYGLWQADRGDLRLEQDKARIGRLKILGLERVQAAFSFAIVAYNLIRLPKLLQTIAKMCLTGGK